MEGLNQSIDDKNSINKIEEKLKTFVESYNIPKELAKLCIDYYIKVHRSLRPWKENESGIKVVELFGDMAKLLGDSQGLIKDGKFIKPESREKNEGEGFYCYYSGDNDKDSYKHVMTTVEGVYYSDHVNPREGKVKRKIEIFGDKEVTIDEINAIKERIKNDPTGANPFISK
jgi:hypothetical protein